MKMATRTEILVGPTVPVGCGGCDRGSANSNLELEVAAADDRGRVEIGDQVDDLAVPGKNGMLVDLEPRHEDEGPLVRARVRQRELLGLGDPVADHDQVDVE